MFCLGVPTPNWVYSISPDPALDTGFTGCSDGFNIINNNCVHRHRRGGFESDGARWGARKTHVSCFRLLFYIRKIGVYSFLYILKVTRVQTFNFLLKRSTTFHDYHFKRSKVLSLTGCVKFIVNNDRSACASHFRGTLILLS